MMALKTVFVLGGTNSQLGWKDLGPKPSGFALNSVNGSEKMCKWMRFGGFPGLSACRAIGSVENENTSNQGTKLQRIVDQTENDVSRRLQKDLNSLPSGFAYSNLSHLWILFCFELIYALRLDKI